ncbi:hypothetical protein Sjap_002473 [Stephania japonica]|uniref:Uncharacterized protein n=1 Tax=Stephania japonica TaxID=461633 RepID=A0AAP0KLZ5_9MAGN
MEIVIELAELINWQAVRFEKSVTEKNIVIWNKNMTVQQTMATMKGRREARTQICCENVRLLTDEWKTSKWDMVVPNMRNDRLQTNNRL